MERRDFIKVMGISAVSISTSGFAMLDNDGHFTTDCATSTDILGPYFRKNAPRRHHITLELDHQEIPIKVVGQILGADCKTPISGAEVNVWHCDNKGKYDMTSKAYKCRGRIITNENGEYWYKTFVPPPYGKRPKHIHYLIDKAPGYERLVTQLYFKGDDRIKSNNWIKYEWDERRILDIYKNEKDMAEVKLDLYLTPNV